MFEVLLYADLNCTDAAEMLNRIEANKYMDSITKLELVELLQEANRQGSSSARRTNSRY